MKRIFTDRPIQSKLLISFLPILVLSVAMTGWFSYLSVAGKLQQTTYYSLSDLVQQTSLFLDDKFATVFEQLVSIEDHPSFRSILAGKGRATTSAVMTTSSGCTTASRRFTILIFR